MNARKKITQVESMNAKIYFKKEISCTLPLLVKTILELKKNQVLLTPSLFINTVYSSKRLKDPRVNT